ncbi:MAG TPA: tetratricopeptide repeat protein, partial [Thermoanaerobaculia bacterium]|nr:tetratricopeptide repeat protein [Thermoanaerobaculia bacterium]
EVCQETTATLWDFGQGEDSRLAAEVPQASPQISKPVEDAYDEVIDRVFRRIEQKESLIAREGAQARELFDELMRHPAARQHLMVANSVRFLTRTMCEHLLARSHEAGFQDPAHAIDIARLGVAVADRLGAREAAPEAAEAAAVNLRARAWAQLGNALRISSDLEGSERAFATAESLLRDDGRGGMLDRARVFDLLASLRRDQGRYAEAFRLLDRVEATYRRLGHWHLLGRTLAQKSMVCDELGDLETEMLLLRRALDLLDPQEEPRMFLAARHNLILALNQTGRHREAFALLFHTRPLYLQAGDRMNLVRLRWLEGSVAMGLGRIGQAEVAFREVRESFVALGLAYDAAQASLDLANVYILQGRTGETRRLAQEMLAIFQSLHVHREALAAWLVFREAAEMEQAGVGLVRDVAEFLKRARNNHELQFARSSRSR